MKYIFKTRGLGKTSDLVRLCKADGGILIVTGHYHKDYIIKCLCPVLNIDPSEIRIMTYFQFRMAKKTEDLRNIPVYIDDFEKVFEEAIGHDIAGIAGTLTEN